MSQEQVNVINISDLDVKYPIKYKDCEGYSITKSGKIYGKSGKELTFNVNNGYAIYKLNNLHKPVHRLLVSTFIGDCTDLTVNHIDGNKLNNSLENLEIVTQKENNQHAQRTGLVKLHAKPVIQKDRDDNFIAEYPNIKEAVEKTGCDRSAIIKCCNGEQKLSLGFKWEYKNLEDKQKEVNDFKDTEYKFLEDFPEYFVFKDGRIYSNKQQKFLKPVVNGKGACYVTFSMGDKKKNFYVGNIVATLYIPNPYNRKYVMHDNGDKLDNRVENLRWA